MKNEVFELVKCSDDYVILKVNAEDNFVIAMHPYVNATYDYITVTRGKNHLLTVVKKDGTTFSFSWGEDGYTVISESLKTLKAEVVNFIQSECYIPIKLKTSIYTKAKICYNNNFKSWQLTLNEDGYVFFPNCHDLEETIKIAEKFIKVKEWKHENARTGIDVWRAIF